MSLKPLDDSLRSSLRSGVAISSISQCVEEVVHNSIDAGAQSVAVRIDIPKLFLQVTLILIIIIINNRSIHQLWLIS